MTSLWHEQSVIKMRCICAIPCTSLWTGLWSSYFFPKQRACSLATLVLASNAGMKHSNKLYVKKGKRQNILIKRTWIPCGTKFLRVLIFAIFPAIRKNTFPQYANKNYRKQFSPSKIYPRVNILQLKFATQKHRAKKSCPFNHNSSLSSETKRYTMK